MGSKWQILQVGEFTQHSFLKTCHLEEAETLVSDCTSSTRANHSTTLLPVRPTTASLHHSPPPYPLPYHPSAQPRHHSTTHHHLTHYFLSGVPRSQHEPLVFDEINRSVCFVLAAVLLLPLLPALLQCYMSCVVLLWLLLTNCALLMRVIMRPHEQGTSYKWEWMRLQVCVSACACVRVWGWKVCYGAWLAGILWEMRKINLLNVN